MEQQQQIPSELNIFEPPVMSAPYNKVQFVDYRTASPLNDGGPIQFIIPPTATQLIDLRRTLLHVEAKIVRVDKKKLTAEDDVVFPINLPLHSFFNQVDVELQQQLVSSNQLYGYKAMIETLLESDTGADETYLKSQGYSKEQTSYMEPVENLLNASGFLSRFSMFGLGHTVDLEGPLIADICQQDRLLLNGVEVNIKLWPAKQEFMILCAKEEVEYQVVFEEVYLRVCKVMPMSALTFAISETLQSKPALYPYIKTEMRAFQLNKGQYNFHLEDMYQQNIPVEVIVCMVDADAFHGKYKKNPYCFKPFDIRELAVYIDDESVPRKPLTMNFPKKRYVEPYNMLFDNPPDKTECHITRDEYDKGFTIFRFRITPENVESLPNARGNVKLTGTFGSALVNFITC